jgi:hypothetical protein
MHSDATGNDRLVLLALADEANDDGESCYPSLDRLAVKTRCNKRTVMRCIERLEAAGEVVVRRPETNGRGHHNEYTLTLGRKGDSLTPFSEPETARKRREKARPGVHQTHKPTNQNTSVDHSKLVKEKLPDRVEADASLPPLTAKQQRTAQAQTIVREWWDERAANGNPVGQSWIACQTVVEHMLANGVKPNRIAYGLRHAPCCSTAAVELAIQRELERRDGSARNDGADYNPYDYMGANAIVEEAGR